ncbi:hypothetical protein ACFYZN_21695 [Streptomyces sp. NPDC001777]|uniref:hypothetical protein n=1 Tax=Streptomyces sp. NPDC001777 TaxID=3364608 RepID=UPI0036C4ECA0
MRSNQPRTPASRTPRRAPSLGQVGTILTVMAALGVLSRFSEGPVFWLGVLLGAAGVLSSFVTFYGARGWIQMSFGVLAVLTCALFVMQALVMIMI